MPARGRPRALRGAPTPTTAVEETLELEKVQIAKAIIGRTFTTGEDVTGFLGQVLKATAGLNNKSQKLCLYFCLSPEITQVWDEQDVDENTFDEAVTWLKERFGRRQQKVHPVFNIQRILRDQQTKTETATQYLERVRRLYQATSYANQEPEPGLLTALAWIGLKPHLFRGITRMRRVPENLDQLGQMATEVEENREEAETYGAPRSDDTDDWDGPALNSETTRKPHNPYILTVSNEAPFRSVPKRERYEDDQEPQARLDRPKRRRVVFQSPPRRSPPKQSYRPLPRTPHPPRRRAVWPPRLDQPPPNFPPSQPGPARQQDTITPQCQRCNNYGHQTWECFKNSSSKNGQSSRARLRPVDRQ